MKKKLRKKIVKKLKSTILNLKNAFSLVELSVSMIIIAIIIAALAPIITKRLTATSTTKNKISTNCDSYYPDGYCSMCYITPKRCIICTKTCNSDEYKNVDDCTCEACKDRYNDPYCSQCNSKRCTQCDNGYYLNDSNQCTPCPAGYYCYQNNDLSIKLPCPKGSANNKIAQSVCEDCQKSSETITGTIALQEGSLTCTPCLNGYYASKSAQETECEICPIGYYCPDGKIIPCQKGYANNQKGQSACTPCIKSNSTTGGTYANSIGQSICLACSNGSYTLNQAQATTCNTCPQGYYCPDGKIIQCSAGTYAPQGSTNCLPCATGTTSNAGAASCFSCAQGCNSCQASASNCLTCKAGYYKNGSSCTICPAGYYCSGGSTGKTICPANHYCPQGSSSAKACPSGYTSNQGSTSSSACKSPFDCKAAGGTSYNGYCYKRSTSQPAATNGHTWSMVNSGHMQNVCNAFNSGPIASISKQYTDSYHFNAYVVSATCGSRCIKTYSSCEMRDGVVNCMKYSYSGTNSIQQNYFARFNIHHNTFCNYFSTIWVTK